jgi:transformation/transcription domain-associated protein
MTSKQANLKGMDPLVLIDSLAVIMGHEEKELCKPGHLALVLILETAINILGSKQKVSSLCTVLHEQFVGEVQLKEVPRNTCLC